MDPTQTTLIELRDAIASKQTSSTEATQAYLSRIEQHNPVLNSYREVIGDYALKRAAQVDAGEVTGKLAGVPIAIKDCMCHTEGTTACSSKMLEHYRSPFTATAIAKLEAERSTGKGGGMRKEAEKELKKLLKKKKLKNKKL